MRKDQSYPPINIARVNAKKRLGETLRSVWRTATFSAYPEREYTDFVFRLPCSLPLEIRRENPNAYYRLFATDGEKEWQGILQQGYQEATHRGKTVEKLADTLLCEIVVEALQILLDRNKHHFCLNDDQVRREKKSIRRGIIRTGPRINTYKKEQMARRLATRYRMIFPGVKKIKRFIIEFRGKASDSELIKHISHKFKYPWSPFLGVAFKYRLLIPGHDSSSDTFSNGEWTPRQIAVGIIVWEENRKKGGLHFTAETIYEKYIRRGNKILDEEEI